MKKLILIFVVSVISSCTYHDTTPDNKPNLKAVSATGQKLSSANNDFAFQLYRQIQNQNNRDNIFISPLSVTFALAMTQNGASNSTRQSISNVLDFGGYSREAIDQACSDLTSLLTSMDRTVNIGIANSVWSNKNYVVRDSFATEIKTYFDGTVQALNFSDASSVNVINSWVESKTNHLIKNIIDQITPDDVMFLINAIYFKGDWTYQFDPSKTYSAPFTLEDGSTQNVTTMVSKGTTMQLLENSKLTLADIPYGNQQFSMTVLMPSTNYSINQLVTELSVDSLSSWLSQSSSITPELELPKFKMSWKKDLIDDLENMGMATGGLPYLFNEPNLPLAISRVIHQSFIDVNEQGTEAAAATAVEITLTAFPGKPLSVKINRPFVFLIREKHTNAILFIGQVISSSDSVE